MALLGSLVEQKLKAARIHFDSIQPLGTPRRLAVLINGLAGTQLDLDEEKIGPPASIAFVGETTELTPAGKSFVQKAGGSVENVRKKETTKGVYLTLKLNEKGKPTKDLLGPLFTASIHELQFQKSMRWGDGALPFGRPVQWMVALLNDVLLPVEFQGIRASTQTYGHRFLAEGSLDLKRAADYVDLMTSAHVLVSRESRTTSLEQLLKQSSSPACQFVPDEFLMDENADLVEKPFVFVGDFDPQFLTLPEDVILSVMKNHQRYFGARDAGGKLVPHYFAVANTLESLQTVKQGNDKVLRARLSDANFFAQEDAKTTLLQKSQKLTGLTFQNKLGSVHDKTKRIGALAAWILKLNNHDEAATLASEAALLCKADLVSLMVGEFPELQGTMGSFYATREKLNPQICSAIVEHHLPKGAYDALPASPLGTALALADRMDTLVGTFGTGHVPTGSQDPFGLRRAALGIVRILEQDRLQVNLLAFIDQAVAQYDVAGIKLEKAATPADFQNTLRDFFITRLENYLGTGETPYAPDTIAASMAAWNGKDITTVIHVTRALEQARRDPSFLELSSAFKRAFNLAKSHPSTEVDPNLFGGDGVEHKAEMALYLAVEKAESMIQKESSTKNHQALFAELGKVLKSPVDAYFESVFVMAEDPAIKMNRLSLLKRVSMCPMGVAHIHLLTGASN